MCPFSGHARAVNGRRTQQVACARDQHTEVADGRESVEQKMDAAIDGRGSVRKADDCSSRLQTFDLSDQLMLRASVERRTEQDQLVRSGRNENRPLADVAGAIDRQFVVFEESSEQHAEFGVGVEDQHAGLVCIHVGTCPVVTANRRPDFYARKKIFLIC